MRSSGRSATPLLLASGAGLLLCAAFVASLGAAPGRGGHPDAPVPGHTGGFGEPTCTTCHFDGDVNPPGGSMRVEGWPREAAPDSTYRLIVSVRHEELVLAGYQAAVRFEDGSQAGMLAPADERSLITEGARRVEYAQHSLAGTEPVAEREGAWQILWTAPAVSGKVWLHVVANAANGDRSEFGDHVYADSLRTRVIRQR